MTQRQIASWNAAFMAALNMHDGLTQDDRELAVRLRENGRTAIYAAARVRIRIQRRQRMVVAGW
jgi:hypothetical protein